MIECLECGRELKMITTQHIQSCSNISLDEYKKKHPNALIIAPELKEYRIKNCKNMAGKTKKVKCTYCDNIIDIGLNIGWKPICKECRKPKTFEGQIYLEKEDKVVCQICWEAFDQITKSHMKLHNISIKEYRKKFPNGLVTNKKIREVRRIRGLGEKNVTKNPEVAEKIRKSLTYTFKDYQEKHVWFLKIEEMSEDDKGNILVRCKNHNCKNSKEKGGWFIPTKSQLCERKRALTNEGAGSDGSFLYCSQYCKSTCLLFHKTTEQLIRQDLINAGHLDEDESSIPGYDTFKQEVFKRNKKEYGKITCEYCGNINKDEMSVHHELPQKTHPEQTLDPINGWVLCGFGKGNNCHFLIGHKPGTKCSTGYLSKLICERKTKNKSKKMNLRSNC